jgi:hypothetical protein
MGVHSNDRSRHQGLPQPRYNAFEYRFLVAAAFASIFDTLNFSTFATESAICGHASHVGFRNAAVLNSEALNESSIGGARRWGALTEENRSRISDRAASARSGKVYVIRFELRMNRDAAANIWDDSIRLDADCSNYFSPLLRFGSYMHAKLDRCEGHRCGMRFGEPSFNDRVFQSRGNFAIQSLNDLGGRILWRANSIPRTRLISRHGLRDSRQIW